MYFLALTRQERTLTLYCILLWPQEVKKKLNFFVNKIALMP